MDLASSGPTYIDELATQIANELDASDVPDESRSLFRMYAVLLLAAGPDVTDADVHNAWVAWMSEREPDHPALRPYDELDRETAEMDHPYAQAIRRVAAQRKEGL